VDYLSPISHVVTQNYGGVSANNGEYLRVAYCFAFSQKWAVHKNKLAQ